METRIVYSPLVSRPYIEHVYFPNVNLVFNYTSQSALHKFCIACVNINMEFIVHPHLCPELYLPKAMSKTCVILVFPVFVGGKFRSAYSCLIYEEQGKYSGSSIFKARLIVTGTIICLVVG